MSESTARHLLGIYRLRLRHMEQAARPNPDILEEVKRLVSGLSTLPEEEKISVDTSAGWTVFKITSTGGLIAKFPFEPPQPPQFPS